MTPSSILITGCSSGIGYAAAHLLKKRGYRVFATARKKADVDRLKAEGLESLVLDVSDPQSIENAFSQILAATGGQLDAVFNNAAYMQVGGIQDLTLKIIRDQFETNTFGAMEVTRRALEIMQKQGHGRIIQNSSILGVITMPYYGAYNASKFALEAYARTLRQELRGTDIHVSLINPGPIITSLRDNAYTRFKTTVTASPSGAYDAAYEKMKETYFNPPKKDRKMALSPDAVVAKLIKALESKHPKTHYFVGWPAHLMASLQRLLPDCAMNWFIAKIK